MLSELLEKIFGRKTVSSSLTAKQRLKLVIAHDRSGLSTDRIEAMRKEILEVVARYVDIDTDSSEFSLESEDGMTALIANLPIRRVIPTRKPNPIAVESQPEGESPTSETLVIEGEQSATEVERSDEGADRETETEKTETEKTETEQAIAELAANSLEKENEELEKPEPIQKTEEI